MLSDYQLQQARALKRTVFLAGKRWQDSGIPQTIWHNGTTFMYRDVGDGPTTVEQEEDGWKPFASIPEELAKYEYRN